MNQLLPVAGPRETWRAFGAEFARMPRLSTIAAALLIGAAASMLVAPWVLGRLVDAVIAGAGLDEVIGHALVIGAASVVGGLLTAAGAAVAARLGETVVARLRERVMDRALHLPTATLERTGTGDLVARAGDDVAVVANVLTGGGPALVNALLSVVLTAGGLFALDWRLGLAGLAAVPGYALAMRWYLPKSAPYYTRERIVAGERSQAMAGALHGAATVRAYRIEADQVGRIADRSEAARDLSLDVFKLYTRFSTRMNRAEYFGLAAVLIAGFLLVRYDLASVGAATAAALYFHRLFNPIGFLLMEADTFLQVNASLARLIGVANLPGRATPPVSSEPVDSGLEVVVREHRYDGGPAVLSDIVLKVAPGERVALVGASGAGKTTLAAIAAGIIPPSDGDVALGGVPLADLGEERVRQRIALVSQEVHVFAGPLATDLRLARPDAGDDEMVAALERAGAGDWFRALPDGLATEVGEGGHRLTSAQAQQLALARLVLAGPAVAVLDEATAEAGSAGARDLDRAATAVTEGRTTLIVAHRLTQAAGADRILVMDHGRVVEEGSHETLRQAGGRYARLWTAWEH
ncbi:ABC transporter ATP-binding protein [Actinoplanes couchii]|uniref:Multidrug ABC transporter permease n=1 Tax=Actinoplanes couchii TaxID=403638 RepID=A0ABQ3X7P2_9ACTN|nr:ABC transporter ATP-binding protein [Actinoplanes couchii]MDR6322338.1 ATP-binding cassette subfamily C protein [Actinoplanes couchii]GID54497.1 multidrug ABC transporter permease [Actinoplanes couchii]